MNYQSLLDEFVAMCREVFGGEAPREGVSGGEVSGEGVFGGEAPGEGVFGGEVPEGEAIRGEAAGIRGVGSRSLLTGIYLHGSMAMGCFNPEKSDIDLIVVVEDGISDRQKVRFMERVVQMNERAPAKGLELSVVQRKYCKPFVYPTPFELHFSPCHLWWFQERPEDYIRNMKGVDRDLAAHFTVINRYGTTLYGEAVRDVFGEVPKRDYADSIWHDVENAVEDIEGNAVYVILNLCRAGAFLKEGLCLSKAGGGEWGLRNVSGKYRGLIQGALDAYGAVGCCGAERAGGTVGSGGESLADRELARQFAADMLDEIKDYLVQSADSALQ